MSCGLSMASGWSTNPLWTFVIAAHLILLMKEQQIKEAKPSARGFATGAGGNYS